MAAPAVASVGVSVWAKTSAFTRGIRRSRKQLKILNKAFQEISPTILKFGTVVSGLVTGALAKLVHASIVAGDLAVKTAGKLGLTTEALTGLQFAAERTGLAIRTFDMGLQRMTRRIAEAAVGTGEAQGAIKELGLDAQQLNLVDTEEKFLAVAEALSKVTNQAQVLRMGFKLFDSEGVAVVNTAKGGRVALLAFMKMAKMLGVALTDDAAKALEKTHNTITDFKSAVRGVGNELASRFAKDITSVVKKLTAFAVWVRTSKSSVKAFVVEMGTLGLKTLALVAAFSGVIIVGGQVVKLLGLLGKAFQALTKAVVIFHSFAGPKGWIQLAVGITVAVGAVTAASMAFGSVSSEMDAISDELDGVAAGIEAGAQATAVATANVKAMEALRKRRSDRAAVGRGRREAFGRQAEQIRLDLRTPSEVFGNEVDKLNMLYRRGMLDIATYDKALAQANREFEDASGITALADAAKDAADEMKKSGEDLKAAMRTPREVYEDTVKEYMALLLEQAISLDTYKRALIDANKTMQDASGGNLARTFEEVSRAQLAVMRAGGGAAKMRKQKTEDEATKQTAENTEETNTLLRGGIVATFG